MSVSDVGVTGRAQLAFVGANEEAQHTFTLISLLTKTPNEFSTKLTPRDE